jgi:hypothetical protein
MVSSYSNALNSVFLSQIRAAAGADRWPLFLCLSFWNLTELILLWVYYWHYRSSRVRFPTGAGNFSLHQRVPNGSGAHPASYPMGTSGSFRGVKRPGREADHSPPSSAEVKKCVVLYLHSPSTPSWRGTQLKKKHNDNFTFFWQIQAAYDIRRCVSE